MEQMITSADFMHTDQDDMQHAFSTAVSNWARNNSESVTLTDVFACMKAAQAKVCRPDFPPEGSSGYYMGYHLLKAIQELVSDLIDESKAQPTDFHEAYLDFILLMIDVGPLSSHVEYIYMLMDDRDVDFREYFQSLRGKKLTKVVHALKKEYKGDPGMDWKHYLSVHFDKFTRVMISDRFSDDQLKAAHGEFLDLYMFFNLGFNDRDEDTRKAMHRVAYLIDLKYDRNMFKNLQDADLLKQWFVKLGNIILSPEFPQAPDVADEAKDDLSGMLKAVSEEALIDSMYDVIMDLALDLTIKKAGCEGTRKHFETIGYFFSHISENGVKNNEELFELLMQKYIYFLDHVKDETYLTFMFVEPIMYDCLRKSMGVSDDHVHQWIMMIKALLRHSIPDCINTAYRAMRAKDKVLKWKKYPDDIKEIFGLLSDISLPKWLTEEQHEKGMEQLKELTDLFLDEAKKAGIVKLELTRPMLEFVFHCVEMRTPAAYSLAEAVVDKIEYNAKKDKGLMMEVIRRVTSMLEDDTYDWDNAEQIDLITAVGSIVNDALSSVNDGKLFTWEEYDDLIYLAKLCQTKMLQSAAEPALSVFFRIYLVTSIQVVNWLQTMNESHRLIPLIPGIIQMLGSEEDEIQSNGRLLMAMMSQSSGSMFARYLDNLIVLFLDKEQHQVLMAIVNSYEYNPSPLEKHFDEVFEHVDSGNSAVRSFMLQLLQKVAKHQPQLFTEEKVGVIVKEAKEDSLQQVLIVMILAEVAKRNISIIEPFIEDFMNPDLWQPMSAHSVVSILQLYALGSEEKAHRVITYLMERITSSTNENEVISALNACRLIGFKHRPAIEKHRSTIENFKESTSDNSYHTCCVNVLDMLDGKSLDKIALELKEVQGDVADLDVRVTATESDIAEVKETVQQQGDDLDNVKNEVSEQGQRLDQVEETVDDTVAKVQEIDSKTLSHAPYWARDVSRLLNVEADNDWRLLSLRLGFSNDDIRAWAQQADPCMAMLNEWYATHKTREATHAVLTSLQLLDREDAAVIVENAMKNAEAVVEDEEFEYATPPDIFISYQWGHQDEVRLLRQHLEMAGFSCWMDVGQMGGGDKLFEKIDSGIRGAKVVISCVTGKYAKSPNCNREVNLAVSLDKPIIPLLMEKMMWPPPGSMGPIFSEYLFIRFFQRDGEETEDQDQRYWPLPKFQELLMQLSVLGIKPDEQVVQPEYKDWWLPKVEEVTVDKQRAQKQTAPSSAPDASDEKAAASPDVFISYQWGKQPQILKLYKRLTSLGYTCWLDIMQMGGGDSLYEKIDRGLRGSHVVLSCITTKYAKSANCRREVSLADALQKPLIPLLLENLSWPPPGPMSPILTQLLYIDCTMDNMEDACTGPKFDELIAKINQHVPKHQVHRGDGDMSPEKPEAAPLLSPPPPPPVPAADIEPEQEQESQLAETVQRVEKSEAEEGPAPVENTPSSPVASQPHENTEKNNSESQSLKLQPPAPIYDDAEDNQEKNNVKSNRQEEQKPALQTGYGRELSEEDLNSLCSDLGHDGFNVCRQDRLMQMGGMTMAPRRSSCCIIL